VPHLSIFNYISIAGHLENTVTEFVDHLHEHFVDPCEIVNAHYVAPRAAGYSITMRAESLAIYAFPNGSAWRNV
jgi:L-fuconate dehydratase